MASVDVPLESCIGNAFLEFEIFSIVFAQKRNPRQGKLLGFTLFITIPVIAFAQKESPTKTAPKPTIAQVRKLVSRLSKLFGE
jgi:hypothetical protein